MPKYMKAAKDLSEHVFELAISTELRKLKYEPLRKDSEDNLSKIVVHSPTRSSPSEPDMPAYETPDVDGICGHDTGMAADSSEGSQERPFDPAKDTPGNPYDLQKSYRGY
jgi:hypothetical protein